MIIFRKMRLAIAIAQENAGRLTMRNMTYIGLGSNWENGGEMLARAVDAINGLSEAQVALASSIYRTEPQGLKNQPWFVNQALKVETGEKWQPRAFLAALLDLEKKLGRRRSHDPAMRFGPRKIDIDLLLFANHFSAGPECILPHPRMTKRAFVLVPLREIEPSLIINGKPAGEWLELLDWRMEGDMIFQC